MQLGDLAEGAEFHADNGKPTGYWTGVVLKAAEVTGEEEQPIQDFALCTEENPNGWTTHMVPTYSKVEVEVWNPETKTKTPKHQKKSWEADKPVHFGRGYE